jgi:parallel beta-helix repeat protein
VIYSGPYPVVVFNSALLDIKLGRCVMKKLMFAYAFVLFVTPAFAQITDCTTGTPTANCVVSLNTSTLSQTIQITHNYVTIQCSPFVYVSRSGNFKHVQAMSVINPIVEGCNFDGSGFPADGISFEYSSGGRIENNTFSNFPKSDGAAVIRDAGTPGLTITSNSIGATPYTDVSMMGIFAEGPPGTNINNLTISSNTVNVWPNDACVTCSPKTSPREM